MGRQEHHGVANMEMLKQSLTRTVDDNRQMLKEAEARRALDRMAERESEVAPEFMNRAARRRAAKLARKQHA